MKFSIYRNQDNPETGEAGFDRMFMEIPSPDMFVQARRDAQKKGWSYFSHEVIPGTDSVIIQFYKKSESSENPEMEFRFQAKAQTKIEVKTKTRRL